MRPVAARSLYAIAFGHCLARAALPGLAAAGVALAGATFLAPALGEGVQAPGAMTNWLGLPLLVIAAVVAATAIGLWPTFCTEVPGSDWVRGLQRGPWNGCGAVLCGALAAQLALTLPLTTWLARGLGAPSVAVAHLALPAPGPSPVLSPEQPRLGFRIPSGDRAAALELRPLAALPGGALIASRIAVFADGERLTDAEVVFDASGQVARLTFAKRRIERLELELLGGNVPLFFPDGAVMLIGGEQRAGTVNGVLAAVIWLLPTFVALAFACLCGSAASRPTVLTVAFALLLMLTVAGIGPGNAALLALLRGSWLASAGIFTTSAPSLAAGFAAMIGAMLLRRRQRA